MRIQQSLHKKARIDMIPLMDSMFLLLVFFIYAMMSMVVHQGIPLQLPEASQTMINQEAHVTVSIDQTGKIFIDKKEVPKEQLSGQFVSMYKKDNDLKLFISADTAVSHGTVITVLDEIRKAGITSISFETQKSHE